MSKFIEFEFCELPDTPREFDITKFESGDPAQIKLYKDSKVPRRKKKLSFEKIEEDDTVNFARVVPEDGIFLDFDNPEEAEEMYDIIIHSGLNCLVLETTKGYHFLFRVPDFYKKEMTGATNWFGYKFDTKATTDTAEAVQIIRVCGMLRKEICSWDLDTSITTLDKIDLEELNILPYWLWGKLSEKDLHKKGKPGDSEYTLTDTPFTQLMKMKEGGRHTHIVERCSYFALSNGFEMDEFKSLITAIHDQYLAKIGTPMPDSDLFGDLEERLEGYKATLESSGWSYEGKERKWKKATSKTKDKIDERRAAEWLYKQFDFYVKNQNATGIYTELLYREIDGSYEYQRELPKIRKKLKEYSNQNFKKSFFEEVEGQLMQMCAEDEKLIKRSHQYVLAKNKALSCIIADAYDFSWLGNRPPTDVVFRWSWQSEEWVKEHEKDLGGLITKFIKELSRNASGDPQPEVEQWLWVVAGASMIPKNELEKIIILLGGGNNGKSVYTSLIRLCLGENMYNTSKIFDSDPHNNKFWGEDFDQGICCIVDDLPPHYNKATFSYLKGAITKSDNVVINEKHKAKRKFAEIPQIIVCSNQKIKLNDKSEGMKRRIKILPTECHIEDEDRDANLQHKLVLNTTDSAKVAEYKMSEDAFNKNGTQVMNLYTKEKCVLDSLENGSLCWFANKARYEYFNALKVDFVLGESDIMKSSLGDTFKSELEIQCENFINWYIDRKCGIDSARVLSKANIHFNKLYPIYVSYCEVEGIDIMGVGQFNIYCSKVIKNLGYQIEDKKMKKENGKSESYRYVVFGEEVDTSKQ